MSGISNPRIAAAIQTYFDAITARSRERWFATFSDSVVCHDPVGHPPAETREHLEELWNMLVGPFESITMQPDDIFEGGPSAAVHWSAEGKPKNDSDEFVEFDGITVFEIDDEGKIQTLMAYWDPADVLLRAAGEPVAEAGATDDPTAAIES